MSAMDAFGVVEKDGDRSDDNDTCVRLQYTTAKGREDVQQ